MSQKLSQSQQTRLTQKLNPRQVILGRVLEMSALEIEDHVRHALDENPALEALTPNDATSSDDSQTFSNDETQAQQDDFDSDDDISPNNYSVLPRSQYYDTLTDADNSSIYQTLSEQIAELDISPLQQKIAQYIIGNIDDNGYLTRSITDITNDIAIAEDLDISDTTVKQTFDILRTLDPAGIAAVDLRDCLLLQIDRMNATPTTQTARQIIADYFDLFSKKHFDALSSHLGIDRQQLAEALNLIKSLNPKPGALLERTSASDRLRHIIPDFAVEIDANQKASVTLLNNLPELAISQEFQIDNFPLAQSQRQRQALAFIRRCRDDAQQFIDTLSLRARTLLAVIKAIVKIQHKFFTTGDRTDIRPMIIKDIAALTGLDISVISRAAAAKYVLTQFGIFPLKMFFNERPKEQDDTSSHQILDAISNIIQNEDKHKPLSDDAITQALQQQGFDLARRTVTKYRERLQLPVARLRKQL